MTEIESETKFIWKLVLHILLTPITLIQVIFKKKELKELFQPFIDIWQFLIGPKFTITIITVKVVLNICSPCTLEMRNKDHALFI